MISRCVSGSSSSIGSFTKLRSRGVPSSCDNNEYNSLFLLDILSRFCINSLYFLAAVFFKIMITRQNAWQKADRIRAVREWQTDGCRNLISAPLDRGKFKADNKSSTNKKMI